MRFYTNTHSHYCGIDLHAKTMYLCILDRDGEILLHKNIRSRPESFLEAVAEYGAAIHARASPANGHGLQLHRC